VVSQINFHLDRLGSLGGFVRDALTGTGIPLVTMKVAAGDGGVVATTTTSPDGSWTVGVPADVYYVYTESPAGFYTDELFQDAPCEPGCDPLGGTAIPVGAGEHVGGIDFDLLPTPGVCALDVTTGVSVSRGGFRYNYGTRQFMQQVTITNVSRSPMLGPVSMALHGLSASATLTNAGGMTACQDPVDLPYVDVAPGDDGVLSPGESVALTLQFANPSRQAISYGVRVLAGPNPR
jgi:hypothetical protein